MDRAKMAQILNEQNMENMQNNLDYNPQQPRFSVDSAVYLGKLLGVPAIIFVRVDAYYGGQRPPVNNGKKHTISGNVVLKATAQIVNVETGTPSCRPVMRA